jgi:hypothetical protein
MNNTNTARRQFALWASTTVASLATLGATAAKAQSAGGRPPGAGGAGGGHMPRDKAGELPRCPSTPAAGPLPMTAEQIRKHFDDLKNDLNLSGDAVAAFDAYVRNASTYLLDEERLRSGPKSISLSGSARIDRMFDDARNRYTAAEDLQDALRKLNQKLSESQRKLADPRLLPLPETPRQRS